MSIQNYIQSIVLLVIFFVIPRLAVGQKGNQAANYKCSEVIDIDSTVAEIKPNEIYFYFDKEINTTTLKSTKLDWLANGSNEYLTGYLINTTDSTFTAAKQDGSLIMIQEALDKNGKWRPIEYWVYSGCGNSYFNPLELSSKKCVIIPIKKYSGDYKTLIRLKFRYGKSVLYSESFEGAINKHQFKKEKHDVNGILYSGPASYLDDN